VTDFNKMSQVPDDPAASVDEMVELFANKNAAGDYGKISCMAVVFADGEGRLQVRLWGGKAGSLIEAAGMFALGAAEMHRIACESYS
jgi:hypothetical protein